MSILFDFAKTIRVKREGLQYDKINIILIFYIDLSDKLLFISLRQNIIQNDDDSKHQFLHNYSRPSKIFSMKDIPSFIFPTQFDYPFAY